MLRFFLLLSCINAVFGLEGRHFIAFGTMIWTETGYFPTEYMAYGCYCGSDRHSKTSIPLDDTDRCCQAHDACFDIIRSPAVPRPSEVMYTYTGKKGNLKCTNTNTNGVEYKTCVCDKIAAECFGKARVSFNKNYRGYNVTLCKK